MPLAVALLGVGLTDELWSGVAVVSAPEIERQHALIHSSYTLLVFSLPLLLSALLEALVALVGHKLPKERVVAGSLCLLSGSLLVCAWAPTPWLLALGLALAGTASGAGCGAAEARLVESNRADLDRTMARWMLAGALGDIASPLLVAGLTALGGSFRTGFFVLLLVTALQATHFHAISRRGTGTAHTAPEGVPESEPSLPLGQALRAGLKNRQLWLWLCGAALCSLLDELVAALSALRLKQDLGASETSASACVAAFAVGVACGAALAERSVERLGWQRVLGVSSITCALSLIGVCLAPTVGALTACLALLGLCTAAQYPLVLARAYASAPESTAVVNALGEVFVVFEICLPLVYGAIADEYGLAWALALLVLQPVGIFALVVLTALRHARRVRSVTRVDLTVRDRP